MDPILLPFDQYQRYRNVADLVGLLRAGQEPLSILDAGSHGARLLAAFLPGDHIQELDRTMPESREGDPSFIRADILDSGLPPDCYDVVVAVDVYEHIPAERRADFIGELARLSRGAIILVAPFASPGVAEAEAQVNDRYRMLAGTDYPWLVEHLEYGLPDLDEAVALFKERGLKVSRFGHGNLRIWRRAMGILLAASRDGRTPSFCDGFNGFYNRFVHPVDHLPPCYRHFIVAVHGGSGLQRDRVEDFVRSLEGTGNPGLDRAEAYLDGFEQLHLVDLVVEGVQRAWGEKGPTMIEAQRENARLQVELAKDRQLLARLEDEREQLLREMTGLRAERARAINAENSIRHLQEHLRQTQMLADSLRISSRLKHRLRQAAAPLTFAAWALEKLSSTGKGLRILRRHGLRALLTKMKEEFARQSTDPADSPAVQGATGWQESIHDSYVRINSIQPPMRERLATLAASWESKPLISVVMPVYNVDPRWLDRAVGSVLDQIYPEWELCIADDASTREDTRAALRRYEGQPRIRIAWREKNGHICAASNSAVEMATGQYIAFMDNDDTLAENALFEVAALLRDDPATDLVYSDEDKMDEQDRRYDPHFKPDWSPELFLSYNYINHLTVLRRELFTAVGGFRPGFEGAQDYDLLLRVVERTRQIRHIPKILYHWRAIAGSTARDAKDKPIVDIAARKGLEEHLARRGIAARTYKPRFAHRLGLPLSQLDWPDTGPVVTIIIPTFNQHSLLRTAVASIRAKTSYRDYCIMVVDNDSDEPAAREYLDGLGRDGVRVERIGNEGRPFSFSRVNNLAAARAEGDLLLFLNNDIEVREPAWLSRLVGYLGLPGVGATGARLLFPDGTLQHTGVVLCMHGGIIPDHAFPRQNAEKVSYYFLAEVARNCSALTGACLLTRKSDFLAAGGFDEETFRVSLQDVDYCQKLGAKGLRSVYVAGAELVHHQSATRPLEDDPAELAGLRRRYDTGTDPYYNPNLSRDASFVPAAVCANLDWRRHLSRPLKVLVFSHNLERAGAPTAMADLAHGLKSLHSAEFEVEMLSPVHGPLEALLRKRGIPCRILDLQSENLAAGWGYEAKYLAMKRSFHEFLANSDADLVVTNTLFGFCAVTAARAVGLPALWVISETLDSGELGRVIEPFAEPDCRAAFSAANGVVFGSAGTRIGYEKLNLANNFSVIHNSLEREDLERFITEHDAAGARKHTGSPQDRTVFLTVATICERKNQRVVVEAAGLLARRRRDFVCRLVGANENIVPYLPDLRAMVEARRLGDVVHILPESDELAWHYRGADAFVFPSTSECYPLATLEALIFGLPVVTTRCHGVTEQVRAVNALFFDPLDAQGLASHLERLMDDADLRRTMGRHSRSISEYLPTFADMIGRFRALAVGAWLQGGRP